MSYTEILVLQKDSGEIKCLKEYKNSWGGFARIWTSIYDEYLKDPSKEYDSWNEKNIVKLWPLYKDEKVPEWVRVVLTSTYDGAIVEKENLLQYADFLEKFVEVFPAEGVDHLSDWAKDCREQYNNDNCLGICYYGTSFASNYWRICEEDNDGSGWTNERSFNINVDKNYFYVFEELKIKK